MKNIGLDIKPPESSCNDDNCHYCGSLKIRGRLIKGRVASSKSDKLIVVERPNLIYVSRYNRYQRGKIRVNAHLPPCISINENDEVTIAECRQLSKTVSFVVVGKGGN